MHKSNNKKQKQNITKITTMGNNCIHQKSKIKKYEINTFKKRKP
jgi:hypothetical protein